MHPIRAEVEFDGSRHLRFHLWYIFVVEETLTLEEAGRRLGVTRRRVQAMVSSGSLPADKRGAQWFVSASALRGAAHNRASGPGRPLTARTAWERVERLALDGRRLAAQGQLDEFRKQLRPRAAHLSYYVHPGLLDELRSQPGVVLGGRDAAAAAGAPVGPIALDLYVTEGKAGELVEAVLAKPAGGNANVFAHVVAEGAWPFHAQQRHTSPWIAWLDLEDRQDRAAVTLLDRLIGGRARA